MSRNGLEIFDRYDFAMCMLLGLVMVGILALGAPLWTALVIMIVASVAGFIRHFDEIMGP
jgi:Flp pilus assembly protein TadB